MKRFSIIFSVFLLTIFASVAFAGSVDTAEQAYEKAVSDVLEGKVDGLGIFATRKALPEGTVIEAGNGPFITLENNAWLVFIDDFPGANWSHGCRYILVEAESGDITVKNGTWPPTILKDMIRFQGPDPFGGENRRPVRTSQIPKNGSRSAENLWAVILSGGHDSGNNHVRYWNDCSSIYMTLVNYYGYLDENIIVAISDGLDPAADQSNGGNSDPDLDGDGDDDIMYSCVLSNVDLIFASLASTLGAQDTLFIFTTDHGSGTFGTPGLPVEMNLWNHEVLTDAHFATLLEGINCREMIITMEPCFSGGFINDVIDMASTVPRVISTAANDMEYSWAMPPDYVYDTYVFHWTAAVNWADAYGVPVDADTNSDGEITMDEAYIYAEFMDEDDEHPQYAEWPAGYGAGLLTLWGSGPTSEGVVNMDRGYYNCMDTISIVVEDLDLAGGGTTPVIIDSTTEPGGETVILTEVDQGRFEGTIDTQAGSPGTDDILQVAEGDNIIVTYEDANYGGGGPMTLTDEADVDCTGPVISGIAVSDVTHESAVLNWNTNEAATSKVEYGIDTFLGNVKEDTELLNTHALLVDGLSDCTYYYCQVVSQDEAGNETIDNNGGAFYTFTTWELVELFTDDVESGTGNWSAAGLWHVVDPGSGCNEHHSADHSWYYGQEPACNYDVGTTSGSLTSEVIDLTTTTAAELTSWYWHEGEGGSYDLLYIQVYDGSTTDTLETISGNSGGWQEFTADLSSYIGGTIQLIYHFDSIDDLYNTYRGSYIDDVTVTFTQECTQPSPTPGCINDGDVDQNGSLTSQDAQIAFQIVMGAYTPTYEEWCAADCNGDGEITSGDAQGIFAAALGYGECADPV